MLGSERKQQGDNSTGFRFHRIALGVSPAVLGGLRLMARTAQDSQVLNEVRSTLGQRHNVVAVPFG